MSGEIFELGDIGLRAVWRAEIRGGAWDASFGGKREDARAALCGERCGFSGLAEGIRTCEVDLSYGRGVEG